MNSILQGAFFILVAIKWKLTFAWKYIVIIYIKTGMQPAIFLIWEWYIIFPTGGAAPGENEHDVDQQLNKEEPEVEPALVKSPPEPTRVKSPEQILMRSPEPVNWTVPLDTGKTFTVTQNVHEGKDYVEFFLNDTLHDVVHSVTFKIYYWGFPCLILM